MPNYAKKGKINKKIPIKIIERVAYGYDKISIKANFSNNKYKLFKGDIMSLILNY